MADLRVVSERSERELQQEYASSTFERAVRELAANIMRVSRGAGRPVEIAPQALAVSKAAQAFWDAHQRWPADELHRFLDVSAPYRADRSEHADAWQSAEDEIVDGALQIAASTLLGQLTQRAAGDKQMIRGVQEIERLREANRREWQKPKDKKGKVETSDLDARLLAFSQREPKPGDPA
jgi:uncharacterized membrane protein YccC